MTLMSFNDKAIPGAGSAMEIDEGENVFWVSFRGNGLRLPQSEMGRNLCINRELNPPHSHESRFFRTEN